MGEERIRERSSVVFDVIGTHSTLYGSGSYPTRCVEYQKTRDTLNGWRPKFNTEPPAYDIGGPFFSERFEIDCTNVQRVSIYKRHSPSNVHSYTGPIFPIRYTWDASTPQGRLHWNPPALPPSDDSDLIALGTTAISRCAPTSPHASVATTIGELRRDGIPAITGLNALRKRGTPSSLAGEYLNMEFGWKPLVSDVRKFAKSVSQSERILKRYREESGKLLHRSYSFPTEVSSTVQDSELGGYTSPALDLYCVDGEHKSRLRTVKTTTVERWFDGAFTYKDVVSDDQLGRVQQAAREANHLLGILPTPSMLYNLTPWSWALDWFTNTGDVVDNVTNMLVDGLVMRYGYMMEKTTIVTEHMAYGPIYWGAGPCRTSVKLTYTRKRRIAASPFGFGITAEAFTPWQWSIVAALGLTQGGRYVAR